MYNVWAEKSRAPQIDDVLEFASFLAGTTLRKTAVKISRQAVHECVSDCA